MPAVLGYWKIRGIGQPIRLLLHYVGEEFEDKYYECGPAPNFNKDKWLNEKNTLCLPFPNAQASCEASMSSENRNENEREDRKKFIPGRMTGYHSNIKFHTRHLPYYIDGDVKITQSNAILRHIARKHNMCGQTEGEMVRVDMLADQAMDLRSGLNRLVYNPRFNEIYAVYMKELPRKLKELEDFLGDKKFLVSNEPTFPDFSVYELLDQHRVMAPDCLDNFRKLKSFMERIENLERIKSYMQSEKFIRSPLNNKMAKFGAD